MVKIEVTVVETKGEQCTINIKRPKHLKSATEGEKKTANVVKNSIDNAIEKLSKGEI